MTIQIKSLKTDIIIKDSGINDTETIIDIQVLSTNENLSETLFLFTDEGNIYYHIIGFDEFKFH